jgi:predicted DNA-binding transcriptional regulator AlpA
MRLIVEQLEADMNEKFYTVTELSKVFSVSRQAIHNWLERDRFPNKFEVGEGGGMIILVPASDVEKVKKEEADKLVEKLDRLGFQTVTA